VIRPDKYHDLRGVGWEVNAKPCRQGERMRVKVGISSKVEEEGGLERKLAASKNQSR